LSSLLARFLVQGTFYATENTSSEYGTITYS
jgi:hypothetical protein